MISQYLKVAIIPPIVRTHLSSPDDIIINSCEEIIFKLQPNFGMFQFNVEDRSIINYSYCYYCSSCANFSSIERVFKTDWFNITNSENELPRFIEEQIGGHAEQHSIMWAWAKKLHD